MPSSAHTRKDPQKGKKEFSTNKGFTLIELLIVVGVLAVITSLALPSYRTILEKRQVASGAEQIAAFLSTAQIESVKHSQFVAVKYQAVTGGWCIGMRADDTAATTCDCSEAITDPTAATACSVDNQFRVLRSTSLNYPDVLKTASIGGGDNTIVYDPVRGLIQNSESAKLQLVSDKATYALDVEVAITGRVKICSKKSAPMAVPGYKECST